jgi:hypothetical protein
MKKISLQDREACGRCGDLDPSIRISLSRYRRTGVEKNMLTEEITKEVWMVSYAVIRFEP